MKQPTGFLGTYFELDAVLRLERWVRIIAWLVLVAYFMDSGITFYQVAYGAISNGYPLDWAYVFQLFSRLIQGGVLFMLMQAVAKILLIMLDIEDNTRRAGRVNTKEN